MSKLVIDMMGSDLGSAMSKEAVRIFHSVHPDCSLILVGKQDELADMPNLTDEQKDKANTEMKSFEAIVDSMTPYERHHPESLKYSEKNRIAKGSGKTNADVNRVIRKWEQSKEMMKQMKQYQKSGKVPPGFGGGH